MRERPKALIVGAGPTGLVMAHELARDGIQCRLIDKAPHRAMESRAIAIHSRTVETFELMGSPTLSSAPVIESPGSTYTARADASPMPCSGCGNAISVCSRSAARRNRAHPRGASGPARGAGRADTELISLAQRDSGVSVRLRAGGRVEEVETDWLLGCDGAHSTVREQLGISFSARLIRSFSC